MAVNIMMFIILSKYKKASKGSVKLERIEDFACKA